MHLNGRSFVSAIGTVSGLMESRTVGWRGCDRDRRARTGGVGWGTEYVRDRSCLLRCSLLLKARLQNWHLYFLSGTSEAFREVGVDAADDGMTATLAPGILLIIALAAPRWENSTARLQ